MLAHIGQPKRPHVLDQQAEHPAPARHLTDRSERGLVLEAGRRDAGPGSETRGGAAKSGYPSVGVRSFTGNQSIRGI
jgi:hypothetical protein